MVIESYFGDWLKVIDISELNKVLNTLTLLYEKHTIYPSKDCVFKAFNLCNYDDCKIIIIGLSPYSDGNATGIAFANNSNSNLSPSLEVIKNATKYLQDSYNLSTFDPTLESWEKQGVLLLNAALTVEKNKPESHLMLWRPFMTKLLHNLSEINSGIVYILFGSTAATFEPYIGRNNNVLKEKHPSWYARLGKDMPSTVFREANKLMKLKYNLTINWYEEI